MAERKSITILVPAYNEAERLPALADAVAAMMDSGGLSARYDWQLLVVDDGSRDDTREVLRRVRERDAHVAYVSLSRNFGKENAMLAGMDFATGDCVVIMDADLQHPVDTIPEMVRCWEEGYDDVYGRRMSRGREPLLRRKLSLAYYRLLQRSTSIEILENVGDFRLLDRRCVDALRSMRENQRNTKGLFCWIGFRKKGVDYVTADNEAGRKSRFGLMRLINLAVDGITGFSTAPLRFATVMGVLASVASFVYLIATLVKTLVWGEAVQGYPTIVCLILFLGGCQLLAIGIIGEYIGRIFNEVKHRPPYIVDSINGVPYEKNVGS